MKYILLFLLRLYKELVSPFMGNNCVYCPTCSMYMYQAVERFGAICGFAMGFRRLLRCNPFHKGGFDPVPENYRGKIKWTL